MKANSIRFDRISTRFTIVASVGAEASLYTVVSIVKCNCKIINYLFIILNYLLL